jgi:DNA-binding CsgD family transcriptional regulator
LPYVAAWALPELVEASVRSGNAPLGMWGLERLVESTAAAGTDWAMGMEARCRALVSHGDAADAFYREAIDRLGRTRIRTALARAHLLYGEWLRREQRRVDARAQLRTAHEMLHGIGMRAFADRAARELLATGGTVRRRSVATASDLTAQEAQVAQLAREGLSNPEIGARLFVSPRTVQYHLRKVFQKLDITSRGELQRVLARH